MRVARRQFLRSGMALAAAAPAYGALAGCSTSEMNSARRNLATDPKGLLDLPPGFTYQRFSETGETMSDGLIVPARHDGMGVFAVEGEPDLCVLVRNHELDASHFSDGPFGQSARKPSGYSTDKIYDISPNGQPLPGGTTSLVYNVRTAQLEQSYLSLAGTDRNCSGGITPWGSWLSCEESRTLAGGNVSKDHGYTFEVPSATRGLATPIALKEMGRFNHEAVAIDPRTGIVYQTEDEKDGLIYRFLPNEPGALAKGGKLQALVILDQPGADTRNWSGAPTFAVGGRFKTGWIDLDHVESPDGDLRLRGFAKGAALFARGEGMAWAVEPGGGSVYFACTTGGPADSGQIWRYAPSAYEGSTREIEAPGELVLHYESPAKSEMDMCDNIVAAPWGHLVACEDGHGENFVHGIAPDGRVYPIARNAKNHSEFAGACFSSDGQVLFVNMQNPGITLAIRGPWANIALA
ncbi:MAG: alkaline phosphatase PhoX [Pseudomonadota bacterium]